MQKKKIALTVVSLALGALGLFRFFQGMSSADSYNDYVDQLRPLLENQDALLEEIQGATDQDGAQKIDGWLKQSREIEEGMKKIVFEDDWIKELHVHMLKRGDSFTKMVVAEKKYFQTGSDADLQTMTKHANDAGAHLEAFIKDRDRLAKDKNFEVQE